MDNRGNLFKDLIDEQMKKMEELEKREYEFLLAENKKGRKKLLREMRGEKVFPSKSPFGKSYFNKQGREG